MRLAGKTAVVTGGAQGIGRGIVERLCADQAAVVFLDIDREGGFALQQALTAGGAQSEFIECDVTSEPQIERAIGRTVDLFGALDVLVNNAGVNAYFDATALTEAEWERFFALDLKSAWLCCKYAIPQMQAAGAGSIVNIASIQALMTCKGMFPYAAAKAGLLGLTRSLALDYALDNVRVNAVCPGATQTGLLEEWLRAQPDPAAAEARIRDAVPLARLASPAEVASLVAFLASDDASYMTGATILVDGGLSARFAS